MKRHMLLALAVGMAFPACAQTKGFVLGADPVKAVSTNGTEMAIGTNAASGAGAIAGGSATTNTAAVAAPAPIQRCPQCRGYGRTACPTCRGGGGAVCPACNGMKFGPDANTSKQCTACGGNGFTEKAQYNRPPDYYYRDRQLKRSDKVYAGMARVTCANCKGAGSFPQTEKTYCETCKGHGRVVCPACRGARAFQCQSCLGTGRPPP